MTEKHSFCIGEIVERYCPHAKRNVILLRSAGDGPEIFSCLQAEHCALRRDAQCIDTRKDALKD